MTKSLVLFMQTIVLHCEDSTKNIDALCGQNVVLMSKPVVHIVAFMF
jgi:hypothetical protein